MTNDRESMQIRYRFDPENDPDPDERRVSHEMRSAYRLVQAESRRIFGSEYGRKETLSLINEYGETGKPLDGPEFKGYVSSKLESIRDARAEENAENEGM